jgi:uncharacterized protein YdeI (YjbR/CyaY-like superfamily)
MPKAFKTQADFRQWLEKNHDSETELMMRLFKVHARERGIGYREALDEALCWGWIDGVRRAHDEDSFTQRFTPRRKKSNWSAVNIKRVKELQKEGRMCAPGLAAFEARDATAVAPYSFESEAMTLTPAFTKQFRANKAAWKHFQSQAPYYRRVATFWVMSAKREATRARRLSHLIERCAQGRRIGVLET